MGALAHIFEAEGLSTVALSLVRSHTERLKTPRALHCEFPLGRPLGKPGDAEFQKQVIRSAFELLSRPEGPVLEDFPETIDDGANEPLSCALPPRMNEGKAPAVDEALGLRPAYERALAAHGRTDLGRATNADGIGAAIEAFLKIAEGMTWTEAGLPGMPLDVAKDIESYYQEAATALEGHTPSARSAESWFYRTTEAGAVLKRAKIAFKEQKAPFWFYITPMTQ